MQGHFSIYCRLFPSGASSNSLRNLLEYSTSVALTAELDLLVRAPEFLSGQLPSANKLQPSDHFTPREMSLSVDTLLAVADALGYLRHHLQELTERQNASEHTINTTLVGLTAQLQQLTQLITTPAPTVAPPPIPMSLSSVSPPSPVPSAPSKQQTGQNSLFLQTSPANRVSDELSSTPACCICAWPRSSSPAMRKKSSGPLPSSRMDVLRSSLRTSFTRRRTLVSSQFDPGPTLNNNSRVNSFQSMQKQTPSTLWRGFCTIKETGRWTIT